MPQTERGADGTAVPVVPARPVDPPSPRQGDHMQGRDERRAAAVDPAQERLVRPGEQPDATGEHRRPDHDRPDHNGTGHNGPEHNGPEHDRAEHDKTERHAEHGGHGQARQQNGHQPAGRGQHASTDEIPAQREHLFSTQESDGFRERWHRVQGCFVDNPAASVEEADKLVVEAMKTLAEHKRSLETWRENGAGTEELRHALRDYRAFLDRLLRV